MPPTDPSPSSDPTAASAAGAPVAGDGTPETGGAGSTAAGSPGAGAQVAETNALGAAMAADRLASAPTERDVTSDATTPPREGSNGRTPAIGEILEADLLASARPRKPSMSESLSNETVLGIVLIILALIAAFAIAWPVSRLIETGATATAPATIVSAVAWILLAVILLVIAATLLKRGLALLPEAKPAATSHATGFRTSLLGSALPSLSVGAVVMIVLTRLIDVRSGEWSLAAPVKGDWANEFAIAAGIIASVITALLFGRFSRHSSAPDRVNPWQYGELRARHDYLQASFKAFCPKEPVTETSRAACEEAKAHIRQIGRELGVPSDLLHAETTPQDDAGSIQQIGGVDKWVLGTGYVELWQRLHAAEAALFSQRPIAQRLSYGRLDRLRLSGCELESGGKLSEDLEVALEALSKIPDDGTSQPHNAEANRLTQVLISVHKMIDDYRDQSRAGLARTRVHLIWAGIMTAVVAYTLLALAILDDVRHPQIVAGAAFFLVGAVAGLIWQLRHSNTKIRSGEDDFGLDIARLVYVPVLSGLAGVGGVLLMAMLYPTLNVVFDPTADSTGQAVPSVTQIFDLNTNRFGLVIAAVFGLTPDLLINRLQGQADQYRTQLAATSPQTRSNEPVATGLIEQVRILIDEKLGESANASGSAAAAESASAAGANGATASSDAAAVNQPGGAGGSG